MYSGSLVGAFYEIFLLTGLFYETILQQADFQDGGFLYCVYLKNAEIKLITILTSNYQILTNVISNHIVFDLPNTM